MSPARPSDGAGAAFARGGFAVGYEERVDFAELRRQRVARARAQLETSGLDALLVLKDENVRYLTDLRPQIIAGKSTVLNGALLPAGGEPILLCSGGERDRVERTMPWITEAHTIPILEERELVEGFVRQTLRPLVERLRVESIGLDEAPTSLVELMAEHLPGVRMKDGDRVMQRARRVKLPGEIVLLGEASALADAVTAAGLRAVAEGARECEVAAEAMHTLFRLGGEYAHVMTPFVASGERMAPPHRVTSGKLIRHGDIVFIDIGACRNGYFGDVGRTTVCGEPSARQRDIYRAVYDALQACIEQMRPGRTNRDALEATRQATRPHGLEDRFLSLFVGHGVGMGANEPPYVGETLPGAPEYEFQPGMVFAIEPLIWEEGVRGGGGVRLEEMVLVTEQGPQVLSRAPFEPRLLD